MIYQNAAAQPRDELTQYIMESLTRDDRFVATKVLPPSPLKLPTGHVPKITIAGGDLMRAAATPRAPGALFVRSQADITDLSLTLVQYAEELQIPDEQQMVYESYFDLEQMFALEVRRKIQRNVETNVEGAVFNTTNFTATNSGTAYTTGNVATLSFIVDVIQIIRRIKATGEVPNTILIPGTVYDVIRTGTLVQAFIAGSNQPGAVVDPNTIQRAFGEMGIKNVWLADSYVNQSAAGDNSQINPIWPKTYVFVGAVSSGDLQSGGVGRTFYWEAEGPLFNVATYREEVRRSNVIRGMSTNLAAITNGRAGQLITTQA